jgi:ketosteroid isomerase-like protein
VGGEPTLHGSPVDVVAEIVDAWAAGVPPSDLPHIGDEIEFVNPEGALEGGVRRGRAAFATALGELARSFQKASFDTYALVAAGNRVAVLGFTRALGASTGVNVEREHGLVWTIRDAHAVRFEWHHDVAATLASAEAGPDAARVEFVRRIPLVAG